MPEPTPANGMFSAIPRQPDHKELEHRVLEFWRQGGYFAKLVARTAATRSSVSSMAR